ncbi:MAG TPA: glycosyltransferase family 4 protein [Pyrinomonadaceae bacterium]|nr:glycosyltransferase family 4 protein [Pyrinomonadaceae bacterium]
MSRSNIANRKSKILPAPWVVVAGGFHGRGGMDKANAALAACLLARGTPVHLVAHEVAPELAADPLARVHLVARPARSFLLGERLLARRGTEVARAVTGRWPAARVVTNGGNCPWPDVNWVHAVHHAWPPADRGAPVLFRARNRLAKAVARRRERAALGAARLVVANSERTRRDLVERLGLDPARVRTVRLGGEAGCRVVTAEERGAARAWLGLGGARPVVAFVGALGHDCNKGFDTLLAAWESLCGHPRWDAELLAAGAGRGFEAWEREVGRRGLAGRVRLLGFTERVGDVLAAADLLVSPARYESYGLNVREAVARGVPALVSAAAGVAEEYPPGLAGMLLPHADDADDLARRLLLWREDVEAWKRRFAPLGARLRERTWADTAAEFVGLVEAAGDDDGLRVAGCGFGAERVLDF